MNTHSVIVPNLSPLPPDSPRILPPCFATITISSHSGHISKHSLRSSGAKDPRILSGRSPRPDWWCAQAVAARSLAFTPVQPAVQERPSLRTGQTGVPAPKTAWCQIHIQTSAGKHTWWLWSVFTSSLASWQHWVNRMDLETQCLLDTGVHFSIHNKPGSDVHSSSTLISWISESTLYISCEISEKWFTSW